MIIAPRATGQATVLGFILGAVGGYLLFSAFRTRRLKAVITPNGIQLETNDLTQECRWDEIAVIRELRVDGSGGTLYPLIAALPQGTNHQFVVECEDGRCLVFSNLIGDLQRLGAMICDATLSRLLRDARKTLDSNGLVDFGPLTVKRDGLIADDDGLVCWKEIAEIERFGSQVILRKVGQQSWVVNRHWKVLSINDIPNGHVLFALMERLREEINSDRKSSTNKVQA